MDLFDVVRACARRWYVFLPIVAVAVALAYQSYTAVKPVYYVNAVVGLAPPNNRIWQSPGGIATPQNGLLDAGGPALIANLAVLGMRDPAIVQQVVAAGGQSNYGARMFPSPPNTQPLPLIMVEATAPDPQTATKTVQAAAQQVGPVLRSVQQQAGVSNELMVNAFAATPASPPAAGAPSRTRATVAMFAAGLGLAVLAAVLADIALVRRAARRRASPS